MIYRIRFNDKTLKEVTGTRVMIHGKECFCHKVDGEFRISELATGLKLGWGRLKRLAVDHAGIRYEKHAHEWDSVIRKTIRKYGRANGGRSGYPIKGKT